MNLYFNTDSLNFVNSPIDFSPVSNVSFIFGSTQNIGVTLVSVANNGAYVLPSGYNLVLGLKLPGTFLTGNYLAYGSTNLVPNTGAGDFAYGITGFNLYTTGISGLLAQNSSITLAMELEYDNGGSGVVLSNPNTCTIQNSYINLDQVPFMTGALAVYPAPNNIQTVSNLGLTYVGTNQTGLFQPSGNYYGGNNPSGFINSGNLIAGTGINLVGDGMGNLIINSSGGGGTGGVSSAVTIILTSGYTGIAGQTIWLYNQIVSGTNYLPASPNDGDTVTFVDLIGDERQGFGTPPGWQNFPQVIDAQGNSIVLLDTSIVTSTTLDSNYSRVSFTWSAFDTAWYAVNALTQAGFYKTTATLTAGNVSVSDFKIYPTSHITAAHLCTSATNAGALYVSNLVTGSCTIKSTNSSDNDKISILVQN